MYLYMYVTMMAYRKEIISQAIHLKCSNLENNVIFFYFIWLFIDVKNRKSIFKPGEQEVMEPESDGDACIFAFSP